MEVKLRNENNFNLLCLIAAFQVVFYHIMKLIRKFFLKQRVASRALDYTVCYMLKLIRWYNQMWMKYLSMQIE